MTLTRCKGAMHRLGHQSLFEAISHLARWLTMGSKKRLHLTPPSVMEWRLSCGSLQCCVTNRKKIAAFAGGRERERERETALLDKEIPFIPSSFLFLPFARERALS